jgi:alkanesulfonate monooxygenase SsuD/methylene tetrahydromethanopterin reductase-like flavin-dependent oxidoreductase (luciferase family)
VDGMKQMFDAVKQMAKDAGRDPAQLEMVVRANVEIGDEPTSHASRHADVARHLPTMS